eukprot:5226194-Pleurochrysis_carterae.AAC.1
MCVIELNGPLRKPAKGTPVKRCAAKFVKAAHRGISELHADADAALVADRVQDAGGHARRLDRRPRHAHGTGGKVTLTAVVGTGKG